MPWQRGVIPGHAAAAIAVVRTRTGRGRDPLIIGHHAAPFLRARSPGSAATSRCSHAARPFGRCVTRREGASERARRASARAAGRSRGDPRVRAAGDGGLTDRVCVGMGGQYGPVRDRGPCEEFATVLSAAVVRGASECSPSAPEGPFL